MLETIHTQRAFKKIKESMSDESKSQNTSQATTQKDDEETNTPIKAPNVISLLASPSRDQCGYCHGSRYRILSHSNPPKDYKDESEPPLYTTRMAPQKQSTDEDGNHPIAASNDNDGVDEKTSSKSYYFNAHSLCAMDYGTLLDRNWRRSGELMYRPWNYESCCPLLPIRLKAEDFIWEKKWKLKLAILMTKLEQSRNYDF